MPALTSDKVEVYVFRRRAGRVEFLALRRAKGRKLAGVWQPVTGGRKRRESALTAAARELREETGLSPRRWWGLESLTLYFEPERDRLVALPLFAAEVAALSRVRLSSEHDAFRFVSAARAARLFLWESQRRGLEAVRREVLRGGALAKALEAMPPARGRRTRTRA